MPNIPRIAIVALTAVAALIARTPQETKAVLESIAPRDTIVRVAYIKGGAYANFAPWVQNTSVYVVSSEDGVIRKVNTATGNLCMVNITADGKRVLFWDKASYRTYVVNWDGTGQRVVTSSGMLLEYWRDRASGTDWAVMENSGQYRINIDNTASKVQLSSYGCGGLGGGLSDDGTRVVVYEGGWGSAAVGSSSIQKGSGGCQGSMRAGPLNQWSCNESGHQNSFINNPNGTVAFKIAMATPPNTGEGARWTQHPNFFTYMATSAGEGCLPQNPTLLRVSDKVKIGIEDGLAPNQFCGDLDAVFLPTGGVAAEKKVHSVRRVTSKFAGPVEVFSVAGRSLGTACDAVVRGVVVKSARDGRPSLSRTAAP